MNVQYEEGNSASSPRESASYREVERVKGIEPSYEAWEAAVLPLNYTRDLQRQFSASRTQPAVKMGPWLESALVLGNFAQRLAVVSQVQFLQFEETR